VIELNTKIHTYFCMKIDTDLTEEGRKKVKEYADKRGLKLKKLIIKRSLKIFQEKSGKVLVFSFRVVL
jgi:hypothetical protein